MAIGLFKHLFGPSHDDVVKAIDDVLGQSGMKVDRDPILGGVRPDIIAREGDKTYVIEIKQGEDDANLGAVAQVEAFRNVAAEEYGEDAVGMLVVAGKLHEDLSAVAAKAGIQLVQAESADIADVRQSLAAAGLVDETLPASPDAAANAEAGASLKETD